MAQDSNLEQIAQDPLAIFDWFTSMVMDHVQTVPTLADRYQAQIDRIPRLKSLLESAPTITDKYDYMRFMMDYNAKEYGGDVEKMVEIMYGHMDEAKGKM